MTLDFTDFLYIVTNESNDTYVYSFINCEQIIQPLLGFFWKNVNIPLRNGVP